MKTRRANALIFVLGLIFATSIIAVGIVEHSMNTLKTRASVVYEQELRRDAYSALYASLAVLSEYFEIDKNIYSSEQGWKKPLDDKRVEFENGSVAEVIISDESGKLSLSSLTSEELAKIFEEMEIYSNDAKEMADCIIDWSDNNTNASLNGAEEDDYNDDEPKPPNRPIRSFDEFKFIKKVRDIFFDENGNPTPHFETFTKGVSLEHFDSVNLNSASPETLKMMLDIEDKDYDENLYDALRGKVGQISDGIVWVKNLSELRERTSAEVPTKRRSFTAQLLKIDIKIKRGIGEYRLRAYYGTESAVSTYEKKTKAVYNALENSRDTAGNTSTTLSTTPISVTAPHIKKTNTGTANSSSKSTNTTFLKGSYKLIKIEN